MNRIDLIDGDIDSLSADEMRELLNRFRRIFNGTGYGFWEWHLPSNKLEWTGKYWSDLGYDESYIDRINDARQLPDFIYPDDRDAMIEAIREHLRHGEPLDCCYRILTRQGDYVWTQVRGNSIRDASGRVIYISGVNFDISELKRVEDQLRDSEARQARIIQASNDGIWEWYADREGVHFSARCWQLIGYEEHDDVVTSGEDKLRVWRRHIYPPDLKIFENALNFHAEGKGMFDVEYRIYSKQGDLRWIRGRGRIHFDKSGRPTRMAGTNMDITDMKRAEERVIKSRDVAEKANQAKSEFLSSMSHELRTPLNAILGYAQLFEFDANLTSIQLENVGEIRKAGEHLLQLINDVLDLAKIESGHMTVSLEPVLVSRVVGECFTLLQQQADTRGIRLRATLEAHENAYVTADNTKLKQALINLVGNAIKYNKMGGEVELIVSQQEDKRLRITIRDTGQGIPLARQREVFQPFNRLNAEMSKIEGSGVGLVITKRIVEMMHGIIGFSSEENVGTTFWIEMPLCQQWHNMAPTLGRAPAPGVQERPALLWQSPCRILYIEDNPSNIRLLQHMLSHYPLIELDIAEEAFLGIFKARCQQPDIVIMDINLPGMDGYEALSVLRRDVATRSIPVIGLSANAMPYDIEKGMQAGFYQYLTKPVELHRLIDALNSLLPKVVKTS
ncbi:PAS domain-containing protein [Cellvibrio polysaccharolyticus]|uniref:histidine kinase n=1 Tax=Cellvibrio polysaccharolyticus TaxID=2082724 RepID=A0A928V661_9GAMM|nr:PAS domain-containing protein [Cellvibrio polysaccharolyticus]MBE8717905.1 response regulator [Cellvibrio polysaccharolyticus]